jgi:hypothetical protein
MSFVQVNGMMLLFNEIIQIHFPNTVRPDFRTYSVIISRSHPESCLDIQTIELLPILGLGKIGIRGIHLGKHAVQGGNLGDYLFVFRALKLERQLVHTTLDLRARELLREYELDRHRRCISQH